MSKQEFVKQIATLVQKYAPTYGIYFRTPI